MATKGDNAFVAFFIVIGIILIILGAIVWAVCRIGQEIADTKTKRDNFETSRENAGIAMCVGVGIIAVFASAGGSGPLIT